MNREEALAKLQALRKSVWSITQTGRYFDPLYVLDLFDRYAIIRDELREAEPSLFHDLPMRDRPRSSGTGEFEGRGYIHLDLLLVLMRDIDYVVEVLSHAPTAPPVRLSREGVFFPGEYFGAVQRIGEILAQAKWRIVIIDGYANEKVLDLLSGKAKGLEAHILMRPDQVTPSLKVKAQAFNKQYGGLEIRASTTFHDRFVIIDDTDFYHFGASLKDAGHRGFMFSRIEEPTAINALRVALAGEWAKAVVVV